MQQNFSIVTTGLFDVAVKWWEMHRPCSYSLKKHLDNPEINIPDAAGRNLALEIARILKEEGIDE